MTRFPRLYAAASLKPGNQDVSLAEASRFSAALCRGLIEATAGVVASRAPARGFPRLYAAASLKHRRVRSDLVLDDRFSAALCRGLIEA